MNENRISTLKFILGSVLFLYVCSAVAGAKAAPACNGLKADLYSLHMNVIQNFSGYAYSPLIRKKESKAYKYEVELAKNCQTELDYIKSLQRYFAVFRDPHVKIWWSGVDKYKNLIEASIGQSLPNSDFGLSYVTTGVVLIRYSSRYFVKALDPNLSVNDLEIGDELVSCEHRTPEEILKSEILTFESVSDMEAAFYKYAPNIFFRWDKKDVDSFSCEFKRRDKIIKAKLQWHSVKGDYLERFKSSPSQKIYQLEERPYGHLVTLRTLASYSKESNDQLKKFVTDAELLRNDKVIVLDIRGNSGGSSSWGSNWIKTLFGFKNKLSTAPSLVLSSDKNLAHYERLFAFLMSNGGIPDSTKEQSYENLIQKMKMAPSTLVTLDDGSEGANIIQAPQFNGSIIILTDFNVFSSAEIFVQELKQMQNVTHLGIATNASTFCADLRFDFISSTGLVFSLPTKIMTSYLGNRESGEGIKPDVSLLHNPEMEFSGRDSLLDQTEDYILKRLTL